MIRASALVPVAAAVSWQEIVDNVNSQNAMWQAAVPAKFGAPEDVKDFLGAILPGQEGYEEPDVMEIPVANGVPDAFDSATNWPQCAATIANVRDQSACGSCWAFGSVESFEDRACIATGKPVHYSPEDTAFNSNAGMGCNGGNTAWNWFKSVGVVTGGDYTDIGSGDTCLPYSLAPCAHHVPPSAKYPACPGEGPSPVPGRKCSESGYSGSYAGDKLKAQSAYSVRGVSQIQTEIMTNGPLYVSFTVYDDFPTYKSGVYHATSHSVLGGHAVENVGWGTLGGQAYWRIKNSWNEEWGDGGHFKIVRGTNECGIEGGVSGGLVAGSAPPAPGPAPGPAPTPSGTHYEKPPCQDDELQGDVTDASGATVGSVCAPECAGGVCPTDVPEGTAAQPMCALQDQDTGKQYCALACYLDSGCPDEASCAMIGGIFGVCLYPGQTANGARMSVISDATV